MKIAQVVCTFPPYRGGIGNSAYHFAKILARNNHEVTVFTTDRRDNVEEDMMGEREKFTVVRLRPLIKFGNAAILPQLFWKLKNFDIIHLHYPFYGTTEIILLRKILSGKKMKLVLHYHMDTAAKGVKGIIFRIHKILVLPLIVRLSKRITCASLDYAKHSDLAKYYKKNQNKVKQILFGVDTEQFITYKDHKNKQRKEKIILFVGGLDKAHYFKGVENLLEAIRILVKNIKSNKDNLGTNCPAGIKLNIIGKGEMKQYYEKLACNLGIKKYIYFYDNIDNNKLVDFYNYCDVFVLPSINKSEAFGLVLLEAMSCSKPIVASNLPGVRSVFKNNKHGLLVRPDDVGDLVAKLKVILCNNDLAQKMGQAGRELIENKYTWEKVGSRLNNIYHFVKYSPK